MAFGKGRSNKRSSSSTSYASTITTIIFVSLCVLGVWMLTSNSVMPPQTTTRTTNTAATTSNNNDLSSSATSNSNNNDFSSSVTDSSHIAAKSSVDRRTTPAFEDNPGDLPDDAIKSDDTHQSSTSSSESTQDNNESTQEEQKSEPENQKDSVTDSSTTSSSTETSNEAEQNNNDKQQETEPENGNGDGKNEEEQKVQEESSSSVIEENPQGSQGKESVQEQEKQKEHETQTSEESSITQNQQAEQTDHDNQMVSTSETTTDQDTQQTSNEESNSNRQGGDDQEKTIQEHVQKDKETAENSQDTDPEPIDEDKKKSIEQLKEDSSDPPESQISTQEHQDDESTQQKTTEETSTSIQTSETEFQQNGNDNPSHEITKQGKMATGETSKSTESFPGGENSGIPKESKESKKSWSTQADQSENEKERRKDGSTNGNDASIYGYTWQLCNVTAGYDYIPCLDNEKALRQLHSTRHYEHRERHCPEEGPTCLVPAPDGYKIPIEWPQSRDKIWYHNVPHTKLAEVKGHQNWVKVTGEFLTFPGGGTQFIHGALHYIDFVQQAVPNIAWGKHTRVILDVGCGVASFGGYLFERGVLAMSFAPKDEHEAQVQFALERGIPAISAVMGSQRLPFPSRVFDLIHCARCRVPWHENGGALLLELNRVLRPGGYFVWSATPVYQKLKEDVEIWQAMSSLTVSMCWELVTIQKDKLNSVGAAIYRKPNSNDCYDQRKQNRPPMCKGDDDPNAAWYVPLQACMHRAPINENERGSRWPENWPPRVQTPPYWLNSSQMGIYGKPAPVDFATDYEHWNRVVNKLYFNGLGITWSNVRNVMDMRAVYGGFAAALKDLQVWVLNVVNVDSPDTLPIIYERGLFGIYHDWCESFSTYPRTYDLLHADHLFSRVKKRCKIAPLMAEIDRIVRPGGKLIVRDESSTVGEVENLLKSLHWEVHLTFSKDQEGILSARKSNWRPDTYAASS